MALTRHSHFLGHSNTVNCLRFGRKSGQVAATGGDDNMVNLWRMRERETKNIMSLSGHQSPVESLVFDPSERKVVAGSKAGSIKAFDLEAAKVSRTLKGHMSTCTALDYHLYGDYVASGSLDTIVKVWDLRTKSCMQTFKGHRNEVSVVAFTPDGRWLTSGDLDGTIKIWDLTAGRMLREFPDHGAAITALEFNPEEFILVSSSADKTMRIWDVQEFALIGVTPTDNAAATAMCHTVSDPYSGKYLISCSPEAVRLWSYETAIECFDSVPCSRPKDVGAGEVQADATMLEGMKVMGGTIQDAFVSIWVLDLQQLRPFQQQQQQHHASTPAATRSRASTPSSNPAIVSPPPPTMPARRTEAPPPPRPQQQQPQHQQQPPPLMGGVSSRPPTPGMSLSEPRRPPSSHAPSNAAIQHMDDPRVTTQANTEGALQSSPSAMNTVHSSRETMNEPGALDQHAAAQPAQDIPASVQPAPPVAATTTDYIMELRCGMDTCIKTFRARQKCVQQLLVHWQQGRLHEGFRYLSQLPNGKREAVTVDVLRTIDFHTLGLDLEACVLLLPLVTELLESKFEAYLSVAVDVGQDLFNAFAPVVKDSRDARQFPSRGGVNLAAEERLERCATCDAHFQDVYRHARTLEEGNRYPALHHKVRALTHSMADFGW